MEAAAVLVMIIAALIMAVEAVEVVVIPGAEVAAAITIGVMEVPAVQIVEEALAATEG